VRRIGRQSGDQERCAKTESAVTPIHFNTDQFYPAIVPHRALRNVVKLPQAATDQPDG
jgi:hypothetical protein